MRKLYDKITKNMNTKRKAIFNAFLYAVICGAFQLLVEHSVLYRVCHFVIHFAIWMLIEKIKQHNSFTKISFSRAVLAIRWIIQSAIKEETGKSMHEQHVALLKQMEWEDAVNDLMFGVSIRKAKKVRIEHCRATKNVTLGEHNLDRIDRDCLLKQIAIALNTIDSEDVVYVKNFFCNMFSESEMEDAKHLRRGEAVSSNVGIL